MSAEQVIALFAFALAASATPGPNNVMLAAVGANAGLWRGVPALLGVGFGFSFMLFVVAAGPGTLLVSMPSVLRAIKYAGVVMLLWLSWKIATANRPDDTGDIKPVGFGAAALFQWVNPKAWLVAASAVSVYLDPEGNAAAYQALVIAGVFLVASALGCTPWLMFGAGMKRLLRSDRALRLFNGAMGAVLAATVVMFV